MNDKKQKMNTVKGEGQVSVVDFSRTRVRPVIIACVIGALLLIVFPYRGITRDHGSYGLLFEYYGERAHNMILRARGTLPATSDAVQVYGTAATNVPTIMYHGVMARPDTYNLSREVFASHMQSLYDAGWRTITLDEFRQFMAGEISVPEKSFLLTFDDGRKDSFYPVDPLLERFGYTAVLFALPKYSIENEDVSRYYLNRKHLKTMYESGRWDVESHSWDAHSHFPVDASGKMGIFFASLLWDDEKGRRETVEEFRERVRGDLVRADASIKELTGAPISTIAFPFGNYGHTGYNFDQADDIVLSEASAIHDYGFSQIRSGLFAGHGLSSNYPDADVFLINRIDVNPLWSGAELVDVLDGGVDIALPFAASMQGYVGWITPSGVMRHVDKGISLETTSAGTGAFTFLDGGALLSDYSAQIDVQRVTPGDEIVLSAYDHRDLDTYRCVFGGARMDIEGPGVTGNFGTTLFYGDDSVPETVTLGISVAEGVVTCAYGEKSLAYRTGANSLATTEPYENGTISIRLSATENPTAQIILTDVRIDALN